MHELGIVFHIIDSLEALAKEHDLRTIDSVTVEVGEVSTVIPDYLTDCWSWAVKKKELLQNCQMHIESIHAVTHCDGCGRDYDTVAHGRTCPHCGSGETWLITGSEINIKEITVSDETEGETS